MNSYFSAGFCFISEEAEKNYKWILDTFEKHILDNDIKQPNIMITDKCAALKNVLLDAILTVSQILCFFHVS